MRVSIAIVVLCSDYACFSKIVVVCPDNATSSKKVALGSDDFHLK